MSAFTGYLCAAISVLGFGSNFTVVAKYDPGDGMFFQLCLCLGIWCTGLLVFLYQGCPTFYPLALLGGFIWCTGNIGTVFVIKNIGLGPGLVTWGTSALLIGWLTGFFGLFGLNNERPCMQSVPLNVVGFALSVCALVDSTLIKKGKPLEDSKSSAAREILYPAREPSGPEHYHIATPGPTTYPAAPGGEPGQLEEIEEQAASEQAEVTPCKRMTAMLCAIGMGICFGSNFHPSTWIQDHVVGASQDGLDYVFNQFCGILMCSILYFLGYCAYKHNKPVMNPEIVLPGFLSGIMWGIAQTCWFVANAEIGYSAAFPIILIGPGFIGSLWSIFLFKDIYGMRNYKIIAAYFVLACSACACIVMSRKTNPPPPCAA